MFTVCTLRKESGAFATVAEGLTRAKARKNPGRSVGYQG